MSFLHLASTANSSSSSTPSSYLHVNSNGGVSTVPSSLGSNSPSLFGSVGGGKQWTAIGQPSPSSSSSSSSAAAAMTQHSLLKQQQQQHLLNSQQANLLSSGSSHLDSILGLTMASALASSSQTQMEKKFELQQEDFPPLPHRNLSHESALSSSSGNLQSQYQSQYSSPSNHHPSLTNGYSSSQSDKFSSQQQQQQQQHSQSQSPISFRTSMDTINTFMSRHQVSVNGKNSSLTNNATTTLQQVPTNSSTSGTSTSNTNGLPSSTITDQYGLVGLLQMIQQAEKNPDTATLLNCDLTTLGLSMESPNDLHPSFLSPFSDSQARPYEIDCQVPLEYQMGVQIRDKLPQVNFNTLNEDTLFFLFYLFGNDQVQLFSAAELYRRDWRYHKDERLWLTRIKNIMPDFKQDTYETGVYCVFDVQIWRKTHKSMRIDYEKLDVNPVLKQQQQDSISSKLFQQQSSVPQQQQQQPYASSTSFNTSAAR